MTRVKAFYFLLFLLSVTALSWASIPNPFSQKQPTFASKEKKNTSRKNPLIDKPFEQLKKDKEVALKSKDLSTAVKCLDAMRVTCSNPELAQDILREMADLYFEQQDWIKAEKAYKEFMLHYPGCCEYAHSKAIDCSNRLTLIPERDQTKTEETLTLAQDFLTQYPTSVYKDQVTIIAIECRKKLLESDTNIFNFYLNAKNFKAAAKRLELINKERIPTLPEYQPHALELSIELAQAQHNTEGMLRNQLELGEKFPEHDITKRLVTDLPSIKTQLASLEKAKFETVTEIQKSEIA